MSSYVGLGLSLRRAVVAADEGAAILGRFVQEPGEVLDYDFDYAPWFAGRLDAPVSVEVDVEPGLALLSNELRVADRLVKVVLSGASDGVQAKVTCRLTTSAGIVKEAQFLVKGKAV